MVHYRSHKCQPTVPILSQLDPVHTLLSHFLKIRHNIILPSTPGFPKWSLSLRFHNLNSQRSLSQRCFSHIFAKCISTVIFYLFFVAVALRPNAGHGLLILEVFWITHNDAPQSVGLLCTSDQLVAETSCWQHTTLTTDKHPCPRWDSNPRSQ